MSLAGWPTRRCEHSRPTRGGLTDLQLTARGFARSRGCGRMSWADDHARNRASSSEPASQDLDNAGTNKAQTSTPRTASTQPMRIARSSGYIPIFPIISGSRRKQANCCARTSPSVSPSVFACGEEDRINQPRRILPRARAARIRVPSGRAWSGRCPGAAPLPTCVLRNDRSHIG